MDERAAPFLAAEVRQLWYYHTTALLAEPLLASTAADHAHTPTGGVKDTECEIKSAPMNMNPSLLSTEEGEASDDAKTGVVFRSGDIPEAFVEAEWEIVIVPDTMQVRAEAEEAETPGGGLVISVQQRSPPGSLGTFTGGVAISWR